MSDSVLSLLCGNNTWAPISTAPKDGTVIELTALDEDGDPFEIWPMSWQHIKRNGLFPGVIGMWATPYGSLTWNADMNGDYGPTHWRPETVR